MVRSFALALLAAASVAGCATTVTVVLPPPQFRGPATTTVEFVPPEEVTARCVARGAPPRSLACANRILITIGNPCAYPGEYARLFCHELGHVNGWPSDHRPK